MNLKQIISLFFSIYLVNSAAWSATARQINYIKASNTGSRDVFGGDIAIFGDTMVISAPFENSDATGINGDQNNDNTIESGAAYVFVKNSKGQWEQQAYIKAEETSEQDLYGVSVALYGDTLAVGSFLEDSNAVGVGGDFNNNDARNSGAVYIYKRNNGQWLFEEYIKSSNSDVNDVFGSSLALYENTLVVGATGESNSFRGINPEQDDNLAPKSGAVYVFTRGDNGWSEEAYIKASNADEGDEFGYDVNLHQDTLVVGAPLESSDARGVDGMPFNNNAWRSGAVYVFERDNDVWTQSAYLKSSNSDTLDWFGTETAIDDTRIVVASIFESSSSTGINGDQNNNDSFSSGAAYVFEREGDSWVQASYIKKSVNGAGDWFGASIDIQNNFLVISATRESSAATGIGGSQTDNSKPESGAAYLFEWIDNAWQELAFIKASNTDEGDGFGEEVRISGRQLIITADWEASSATGINGDQSNNDFNFAGAAYEFEINSDLIFMNGMEPEKTQPKE